MVWANAVFGHRSVLKPLSQAFAQRHFSQVPPFRKGGRGDHLSQAYLLAGPRGVGKRKVADFLIRLLFCREPVLGGETPNPCNLVCSPCRQLVLRQFPSVVDLFDAYRQEKRLSRSGRRSSSLVGFWKDLEESLHLKVLEGAAPYRVVLIDPVEELSLEVANALLKTLEEPPPDVLFILISHQLMRVLPTIRSRAPLFLFPPLSDADVAAFLNFFYTYSDGMKEELEAQGGKLDGSRLSLDRRAFLMGLPWTSLSASEEKTLETWQEILPKRLEEEHRKFLLDSAQGIPGCVFWALYTRAFPFSKALRDSPWLRDRPGNHPPSRASQGRPARVEALYELFMKAHEQVSDLFSNNPEGHFLRKTALAFLLGQLLEYARQVFVREYEASQAVDALYDYLDVSDKIHETINFLFSNTYPESTFLNLSFALSHY